MARDEHIKMLENMAGVFIRCFFLTYALLFLWFVFYLFGGDWVYNLQLKWFTVNRHEYDLLCYYSMAFIKTCAFLFFLFPYIAIKMMLHKTRDKNN